MALQLAITVVKPKMTWFKHALVTYSLKENLRKRFEVTGPPVTINLSVSTMSQGQLLRILRKKKEKPIMTTNLIVLERLLRLRKVKIWKKLVDTFQLRSFSHL